MINSIKIATAFGTSERIGQPGEGLGAAMDASYGIYVYMVDAVVGHDYVQVLCVVGYASEVASKRVCYLDDMR
jgi:hypothetical protein